MIHDVDATLRALIERDVLNGPGVELSFDAPTQGVGGASWRCRRSTCFLYDIREDPSRRDVFFEEVRDEDGRVIERRQPPRRMRLAYLLVGVDEAGRGRAPPALGIARVLPAAPTCSHPTCSSVRSPISVGR